MGDVVACRGIYSEADYREARAAVLASGQPLCRARGLVQPCVTPPDSGSGYCWMHQHPMYAAPDPSGVGSCAPRTSLGPTGEAR